MTSLPKLLWRPTAASGEREGHEVDLIVVHRWGVRYVNEGQEAEAFQGVVNYFGDPANQASAHVVFPGSAHPGVAAQMVAWSDYAWAEAAYNPVADDIESADACWNGADPDGLEVLALIVRQRLMARGLPAVWSTRRGFCRHADLGAAGGGHLECPTTDLALWRRFIRLVQAPHPGQIPFRWGR